MRIMGLDVGEKRIGIAISDGTADPADIERDADIALYDAKFAGKGQVAMFHTDMHDTAVQRLSLTNQLRGALQRGEINVNYQPIVDLDSHAIVGAEALVRWQHPTRGELAPGAFIGLAEDTGAIVEIGRFVMHRALHDANVAVSRKHAANRCRDIRRAQHGCCNLIQQRLEQMMIAPVNECDPKLFILS